MRADDEAFSGDKEVKIELKMTAYESVIELIDWKLVKIFCEETF